MSITSANSAYSVRNMTLPPEGPRAVPARLDFTMTGAIEIDGSQLLESGRMSVVQGVYINNANNDSPLELFTGISQQVITCGARQQGYFTLLLPNPVKLVARTSSAVVIDVLFYNVPLNSATWSGAGGAPIFDSAGNMLVSVAELIPLISAQRLRTQIVTNVADCSLYSVNAKLTTAQAVLMTGSPGFYLNALTVTLRPGSTGATPDVTATIRDGTSAIAQVHFSVPAVAPSFTEAKGPVQLLNLSNMNVKSNSGNNLNVILSAALTAGGIDVLANGYQNYIANQ